MAKVKFANLTDKLKSVKLLLAKINMSRVAH